MKVNENKYRTCSIKDWVYNIMYNIIRRNALKLLLYLIWHQRIPENQGWRSSSSP